MIVGLLELALDVEQQAFGKRVPGRQDVLLSGQPERSQPFEVSLKGLKQALAREEIGQRMRFACSGDCGHRTGRHAQERLGQAVGLVGEVAAV